MVRGAEMENDMTYLVITLEYGEPLPLGMGFYDHPAGDASCALCVGSVIEVEGENEAMELAIAYEACADVHHCDIQEV